MDENYPRRGNYYSRRGNSTAYERDTRSWKRKREVSTPVAPAQTVDQRPTTNVQDDPDTDKNKKREYTRREVCARWPPAPALLAARC